MRCDPTALSPRSAACRERFLDAAKSVFLQMGYEKASMQEIVKLSGGSLTTLYKQFGSKAGLFDAVLQRGGRELYGAIEEQIRQKEGSTDLRTFLLIFSCHFLKMILTDEAVAFYRLLVTEGPRNEGELGKMFYQNAINRSTSLIIRALEEHLPDLPDKQLAAVHLLAMLKEPFYQRMLIEGTPSPLHGDGEIREFVDRILDRYLHGILPR